jgi:hypothetical protein
MAKVRRKIIEPGARDLLALQTVQGIQGARSDLAVVGRLAAVQTRSCTEIHQATTEAEQHGSQVQGGLRQGFGVRHINVLEIGSRLKGQGDS